MKYALRSVWPDDPSPRFVDIAEIERLLVARLDVAHVPDSDLQRLSELLTKAWPGRKVVVVGREIDLQVAVLVSDNEGHDEAGKRREGENRAAQQIKAAQGRLRPTPSTTTAGDGKEGMLTGAVADEPTALPGRTYDSPDIVGAGSDPWLGLHAGNVDRKCLRIPLPAGVFSPDVEHELLEVEHAGAADGRVPSQARGGESLTVRLRRLLHLAGVVAQAKRSTVSTPHHGRQSTGGDA